MTKFIGQVQLPSGAMAGYHRPLNIQLDLEQSRVIVDLASWPNREAGDTGYAPEQQRLAIALSAITGGEAFVAALKESLTGFGGPLVGAVEDSPTLDLADAKLRRSNQINLWRAQANEVFAFASKEISADALSWKDITGTNGWVSRHGSLPPNWPGGWKAIDNTYVAITTVAEWDDFYAAAVAAGAANFAKAQTLKAQVEAATTVEEVNAITWSIAP